MPRCRGGGGGRISHHVHGGGRRGVGRGRGSRGRDSGGQDYSSRTEMYFFFTFFWFHYKCTSNSTIIVLILGE